MASFHVLLWHHQAVEIHEVSYSSLVCAPVLPFEPVTEVNVKTLSLAPRAEGHHLSGHLLVVPDAGIWLSQSPAGQSLSPGSCRERELGEILRVSMPKA